MVCLALQVRDVLLGAKVCQLTVHRIPPDTWFAMPWSVEDAEPVIHPVVGRLNTQNWVRADRLCAGLEALHRGPDGC